MWDELGALAEALAREAHAAERELLSTPELHHRLALPAKTGKALRAGRWADAPRYTRFDFHLVEGGFRITESNCDVAAGLLEASGVGAIVAEELRRPRPEDPAGTLARAFLEHLGAGAQVGLVHLTEYTDDRQVVLYLAQRFRDAGLKPVLLHPRQLRAGLRCVGLERPLDALYRFIPGDWFEQLPAETGWKALFGSPVVCNPFSALLTQSKRFPLVWPELEVALPTWERLLPETLEPTARLIASPEFVLKPAFGHEGADIVLEGHAAPAFARSLRQRACAEPHRWVLQHRFEMKPLETPDGPRFVCLGVFVVNEQRAGGYARVSDSPVMNPTAQEAAVLVEETHD